MRIKVGARGSKLSRKQVEEVMEELGVPYTVDAIETMGDRDLKQSLRSMDRTDFFTREIDQKILEGKCDVGIHSAKDLPDPLPKGLKLIALTKGVDAGDSLVMREGESIQNLRKGALIGSSSLRRDERVKRLRPDLKCMEVRGAVDRRLAMLEQGEIDGLVVAEAALIRLGLTEKNRIALPGNSARLQGRLAVVSRQNDKEMEALFHVVDNRKKVATLYLGLNPEYCGKEVIHFPLIETIPRSIDAPEITQAFMDIPDYTHFIFTSKVAVEIFFKYLKEKGFSSDDLKEKKVIAVGSVTAKSLHKKGVIVTKFPEKETQEGIIHLLALENLDQSYVFLPQSSKSRPALSQTLVLREVRHQRCILYDTQPKMVRIKPSLESFDEIIFTSPSTVDAFKKNFGLIPTQKKITAIGPVTRSQLKIN